MDKVKSYINWSSIISLVVFSILLILCYFYAQTKMGLLFDITITLAVLMLLFACLLIRRAIKSLQTPFPNEMFIRIHLVNFIFYTLLNIAQRVLMYIISSAERKGLDLRAARAEYALVIVNNIQYPAGVYLDCFLLYLIYRFTSSH